MHSSAPNDAAALALTALAALVSDERRAQRFLSLTGLSHDGLRANVGEPALLAAMLRFLEAHEPDLVRLGADQRQPYRKGHWLILGAARSLQRRCEATLKAGFLAS